MLTAAAGLVGNVSMFRSLPLGVRMIATADKAKRRRGVGGFLVGKCWLFERVVGLYVRTGKAPAALIYVAPSVTHHEVNHFAEPEHIDSHGRVFDPNSMGPCCR